MDVIVFNLTTAVLLILMFRCGVLLLGEGTIRHRGIPWAAVALTVVAVAGVVVQVCWSAAFSTFANDPTKHDWWRPLTAVFLQNNVSGAAWNLLTLAAIAALADWAWGPILMFVYFLAGALLPEHLDPLLGITGRSADPRNFVGSSGATYFLAATLAGALVTSYLRAKNRRTEAVSPDSCGEPLHPVRPTVSSKAAALGGLVPVAGLIMWLTQANGHGLVSVEGFLLGALTAMVVPIRPATKTPTATTIGQASPSHPR